MNLYKGKIRQTSESWTATLILALNLVKPAWEITYELILKIFTFSEEAKTGYFDTTHISKNNCRRFQFLIENRHSLQALSSCNLLVISMEKQ
jgi:hypothetical protein